MRSSDPFDIDIQWFAEDPPEIEFDTSEDEEEFVVLEDGQEPPEEEPEVSEEPSPKPEPQPTIGLDVFNSGMSKLAEALAQRQTPVASLPVDTIDPELAEEIKQGLFDDERQAKTLKKAAKAFVKEDIAAATAATVQLERRLMKVDPQTSEIFTQYESEIEQLIKSKYPGFANTVGIWEHAYREVMMNHVDDIAEMKAQKIAEAKAKPAAQNLPSKTNGSSAIFTEGRSSVGTPTPKKTKRVFITADIQARADRIGMPVEEYYKRFVRK